jgi:HD-like signal output (HDOD) protein
MDPTASAADLTDLAASDMGIATKLMHMACWDSLNKTVVLDLERALHLVGRDALVKVFSYEGMLQVFDEKTRARLHLSTLHAYALENARACAEFCRESGRPEEDVKAAFLAGLLHYSGLIVLAARKPDLLREMHDRHIEERKPMTAIETETLGCDHFTLGGALLRLWGLPDEVVQSVSFSHDPSVIIEPGSPSDALRSRLESEPFDFANVDRRLAGCGHPPLSPELSVSRPVRRPAMETQYAC